MGGGSAFVENRRGGLPRRRLGEGKASGGCLCKGGGGAKYFFGTLRTPTKARVCAK